MFPNLNSSNGKDRSTKMSIRRGAAIAETAICLPFVFLLVVGAIELSSGLYHQMTFRSAVHECASHAADGTADCDDVQTVAQQIMSQVGVTNYNITIDEVPRTVNVASVQPALITHFDIPATGPTTAGFGDVPRGTIWRLQLTGTRPPTGLNITSQYLNSQFSANCVFVKEK